MTKDDFVRIFQSMSFFSLDQVVQTFGQSRSVMYTTLWRLEKKGVIMSLRNGLYALTDPYRQAPLHAAGCSGAIYPGSCISTWWAMRWYGLSTRSVESVTAVSASKTRFFINPLGRFEYRALERKLLFGMVDLIIGQMPVRIALPEKALTDLIYLYTGVVHTVDYFLLDLNPLALARLDWRRVENFARRYSRSFVADSVAHIAFLLRNGNSYGKPDNLAAIIAAATHAA